MNIEDFEIGKTYKMQSKDWETPLGEIIPGKERIRTILEPANAQNSSLDGETPPATVIAEWQKFLRTEDPKNGKSYLLHPETIESAVEVNNAEISIVPGKIFSVYEKDKPAILPDSEVWDKYQYDTFEEARAYAWKWLGRPYGGSDDGKAGMPMILGEPVYFYEDEFMIIKEERKGV